MLHPFFGMAVESSFEKSTLMLDIDHLTCASCSWRWICTQDQHVYVTEGKDRLTSPWFDVELCSQPLHLATAPLLTTPANGSSPGPPVSQPSSGTGPMPRRSELKGYKELDLTTREAKKVHKSCLFSAISRFFCFEPWTSIVGGCCSTTTTIQV